MILGKNISLGKVETTLKQSLQSCWEFEETSGTTVYDSAGLLNIYTSGAITSTTGKTGLCYNYGGSFYNYATTSNYTNYSAITVSAWCLSTRTMNGEVDNRVIVSKLHTSWANPYYNFQLRLTDYTQKTYEWAVGGSSTYGALGAGINYFTNNSLQNQWVHVVGTYSSSENLMTLHINNSHVVSTSATLGNTGTVSSSFQIGDAPLYTYFYPWIGKIDQVAIWNRKLTTQEISTLYNSGNGLPFWDW